MAPEAVQHALAAADYGLAVQLIESYATDMFLKWHAKTLRGWMLAIPPAWITSSPRINLTFAWMHLSDFEIAEAIPYIERLGRLLPNPRIGAGEDASLRAEWLALQAMLSNAQGEPAEALDLTKLALEIAPDAEGYVRSQIYLGLASAYQQLDDYDRSVETYQLIIQHGRAEADLVSELLGLSGLGLMTLQRGELNFTFEMCSEGIERIERSGLTLPISAAVYGELAQVHFHWGQFEQARIHFLRASQVSKLSGYSDAEIYQRVIFSRLAQMQGDLLTAGSEIQKAIDLMQVDAPARVRDEVISQQIRLQLAQDKLAAAEAALQGAGFSRQGRFVIPDFDPDYAANRSAVLLYLCGMRILLHRGRTKQDKVALEQGIELAGRLIAEEQRRRHIPILLEIVLVRAQLMSAQGDSQAGLDDYAWALELAEPEGFITVFVEAGPAAAAALAALIEHDRLGSVARDHCENILTAFERASPKGAVRIEQFDSPQPVESRVGVNDGSIDQAALLTDRELDVLRLMAEGLKYDEIAQRLFISLNTVRSHVKAIYGKLEVNNRTRAIEVARQLAVL
jgi:LuxR family maltose regulon positive regulatory protein